MGKIALRFNNLLHSNAESLANEKELLEDLRTHFPYFQSAAFLQAKILKAEQSFDFEGALQNLALLTQNRELLYEAFSSQEADKTPYPIITDIDLPELKFQLDGRIEVAQNDTPIFSKKELPITTNDSLEFNLEKQYPEEKEVKSTRTLQIIDGFLSKQKTATKITPESKTNSFEDDSLNVPDDLVSETLAKIYIKQEKFAEAIKVYEKLILIEPEKKTKFAGLIEDLNKILE